MPSCGFPRVEAILTSSSLEEVGLVSKVGVIALGSLQGFLSFVSLSADFAGGAWFPAGRRRRALAKDTHRVAIHPHPGGGSQRCGSLQSQGEGSASSVYERAAHSLIWVPRITSARTIHIDGFQWRSFPL